MLWAYKKTLHSVPAVLSWSSQHCAARLLRRRAYIFNHHPTNKRYISGVWDKKQTEHISRTRSRVLWPYKQTLYSVAAVLSWSRQHGSASVAAACIFNHHPTSKRCISSGVWENPVSKQNIYPERGFACFGHTSKHCIQSQQYWIGLSTRWQRVSCGGVHFQPSPN